MIIGNLTGLVARLNAPCKRAMEGAAGLCLSKTHYEVEVEHLLVKIIEERDTDLHVLFRHFSIDDSRALVAVDRVLKAFKAGNTRTPVLSPHLPRLLEAAWLLASVDYGETEVRTGHLLIALLSDFRLNRIAREAIPELANINVESLKLEFAALTAQSAERTWGDAKGGMAPESGRARHAVGATPALDQYTTDLTQRARSGKLDPVLGRDREIRQLVDILSRRRQNNPILTGEAGVGKTAVVEGFALRIAAGDVPPPLKHVAVHALDLGLLQAGASVRGEFENRLKSVLEEVKRSPHPIIMFIDEAHTLIGAGGSAGQGDAANLLKPALARGEMRTIAATTWSEYKKYFEKDAALARRFQVVKVDEPTEAQAIAMLRGLAGKMEAHHQVRVLDEAIVEAVRLSSRYLTGRQLPDKGISVLDTACARVALGLSAVPTPIEDARRRIETLNTEITTLEREQSVGRACDEAIGRLNDERACTQEALGELEARWETERDLVIRISALRERLESGKLADPTPDGAEIEGAVLSDAERAQMLVAFNDATDELLRTQGEAPLLQPCVDARTVGEVISAWTGIPVGRMLKDEIGTVMNLETQLAQRVIGQPHALAEIARRIRTSKAKLEDPGKPVGVFLLVGTSGVGKTETALALADLLYGGERNMITINMSEYQEAHTVSALKGSPPGYVGYGEGGVLTEAVRRRPYSVVLLDEIEKAHPDVLELFYQVFDKGSMEDAEGHEIDFRNTIIILTSNVGSETLMRRCGEASATLPSSDELLDALRPDLIETFKPAFLGRLTVVPYYPIHAEVMREIVDLKLGRIGQRIADHHHADLVYDRTLVAEVASRCTDRNSGARSVDQILTGTLLPGIAETMLERMAQGVSIQKIAVGARDDATFSYELA